MGNLFCLSWEAVSSPNLWPDGDRLVSIDDLYRQGRRAAAYGLTVSIGLGVIKLAGGLLGGSIALVSDAAHSLVDAVLSTCLLFADTIDIPGLFEVANGGQG